MWEEVIIEFTPDEHRYYYDSIRVVCPDSDPVVVPIHGYPVVNTAQFPTAIDFGKCSITETMTKVVPLSSSVPIEFEFELRVLKPSAFFEVSPLQGVIPANGQVEIQINFHPLQLCSAQMNIEVHVSQYDFEPFVCTLSGVGLPESTSSEPLPINLGGLISREIPTVTKRKSVQIKRPMPPPEDEPITIEGILMPAELSTVHAVSGILTSQPGKLKLKDLKAALSEAPNEQEEGAAPSRQLLEGFFMKTLSDETERERNREIRPALPDCQVQTWGDTPQTEDEMDAIVTKRAEAYQAVVDRQHAEGRNRVQTVTTDGKPVHNAQAVPMFYTPSWELDTGFGESDGSAAVQQLQQGLVSIANQLLIEDRIEKRINALAAHLASFGSKEEIASAIADPLGGGSAQEKKAGAFSGVPSQPTLPQFGESELGAPDPVLTQDICCFDDRSTAPLEVPKYFELMEYETMNDEMVPSFVSKETSRLLETGAEEEELIKGWRQTVVRPATALLPNGPPGDLMSHQPTVIPPPPRQPVQTMPDHCKEPVPANAWDLIKPPLRVRGYQQHLRYQETSTETLLGPVTPDMSISSLEEACGSNAVLAMWQLPTYQNVQDHSCNRLTRPWFDDHVPLLLSAHTEDMITAGEKATDEPDASPPEDVAGENVNVSVPHPYQECVEHLAKNVEEIRASWSDRLDKGLRRVNDIIISPKIKLLK